MSELTPSLALIAPDTKAQVALRVLEAIAKPDIVERRDTLVARARAIEAITSDEQVTVITEIASLIKGLRGEIEKSRKALKDPVLIIGAAIDKVAKETMNEALKEMIRLEDLLGAYQAHKEQKVAAERHRIEAEACRIREEAERKARIAEEEARKAQETLAKTEASDDIAAALDAEVKAAQRESEAREAQARAETTPRFTAPLPTAPKISGAAVRTVWDFEVIDLDALYKALPLAVNLTPKPLVIKEAIKTAERQAAGQPFSIPGLKLFKSTKVATLSR